MSILYNLAQPPYGRNSSWPVVYAILGISSRSLFCLVDDISVLLQASCQRMIHKVNVWEHKSQEPQNKCFSTNEQTQLWAKHAALKLENSSTCQIKMILKGFEDCISRPAFLSNFQGRDTNDKMPADRRWS